MQDTFQHVYLQSNFLYLCMAKFPFVDDLYSNSFASYDMQS